MAIIVNKTIPASDWYTSTGSVTITLAGVDNIIVNSKKSLIKTPTPQSKDTRTATLTDKGKNYVVDLKKIEDTIKVRGYLIDQTDSSAWQQAWQLRAMSVVGGPLTSLIIDNLTFSSGTQEAFLEAVTFTAYPARTLGLDIADTSSASVDVVRIEIDLAFYIGDER